MELWVNQVGCSHWSLCVQMFEEHHLFTGLSAILSQLPALDYQNGFVMTPFEMGILCWYGRLKLHVLLGSSRQM